MDNIEKSKQRLRIDESIQFLEKMQREINGDLQVLKRAFEEVGKDKLDIRSKVTPATTLLASETRSIILKINDFRQSRSIFNGKVSFYFSERVDK